MKIYWVDYNNGIDYNRSLGHYSSLEKAKEALDTKYGTKDLFSHPAYGGGTFWSHGEDTEWGGNFIYECGLDQPIQDND